RLIEGARQGSSVHKVNAAPCGVRQSIVPCNADHEAARKLVVAANLPASDPATGRVATKRLTYDGTRSRIAGCDRPILLRPQPAAMDAEITAGPAIDVDRWRSLVDRPRHVRGAGWLHRGQQSEQAYACDKVVLHVEPPMNNRDAPSMPPVAQSDRHRVGDK